MRIFFGLASSFTTDKAYRPAVQQMVADLRDEAVFLADCPPGAVAAEWIATALGDCQFAFFDLTGFDPDVVYALGIATQIEEVAAFCLMDAQRHNAASKSGCQSVQQIPVREFHRADDFQRKVRLIIEEKVGARALEDKVLEQRLLQSLDAKQPKFMRQLARDVGRPVDDVRFVVYALVRKGAVRKIGETSGSQYLPS
jgi:hypothetical protein